MAEVPRISVTKPTNNDHISIIFNEKANHYYDENNNVVPAEVDPNPRLQDWQPMRDENKKFRYKSSVTSTISDDSKKSTVASLRQIGLPRKRRRDADCKTKFIRILFVSSLICTAMFLVFYPLITYYIEESKHNDTDNEPEAFIGVSLK
ncbi:unnamed protein product [Allacma fusca]|uniref:Uncharacterized protein n=1 Tax=Allacma fusca TaxID=39272 RepID=A0A8J2J358_9HEXA|nr:unnamed protein product [Allacma fusca]